MPNRIKFNMSQRPAGRQHGAVMLIMLIIVVIGATAMLVSSLNNAAPGFARDTLTATTLAKVKEALIGNSASQLQLISTGYLGLPDLGFKAGSLPSEGSSAPSFSGNSTDFSVIGKVPWKSLGITPLKDGQGECPWYIVSGRFKNNPKTNTPLNWDTLGQIDLIDEAGTTIASNVAALLISPGQALDGQSRALGDPVYLECGGNYDARNYLDSYNSGDAISGQVNYFSGSTNNRVALNSNNKLFVKSKNNSHYNDQFLTITTDDIYRSIIRRSDFAIQINNLLNDSDFRSQAQSVAVSGAGTKGADNINCNAISDSTNQNLCTNWKEMLLLTQISPAASVTIDGVPSPACNRILIFGGQRSAGQTRISSADKSSPSNYLEGSNLSAFVIPATASNNFIGASTFKANNPSADLLRCLP